VEESLRARRSQERPDAHPAGGLTEDRDVVRVATEAGDVVLHPLEGGDLVLRADGPGVRELVTEKFGEM
jgi:hypothetical protein